MDFATIHSSLLFAAFVNGFVHPGGSQVTQNGFHLWRSLGRWSQGRDSRSLFPSPELAPLFAFLRFFGVPFEFSTRPAKKTTYFSPGPDFFPAKTSGGPWGGIRSRGKIPETSGNGRLKEGRDSQPIRPGTSSIPGGDSRSNLRGRGQGVCLRMPTYDRKKEDARGQPMLNVKEVENQEDNDEEKWKDEQDKDNED